MKRILTILMVTLCFAAKAQWVGVPATVQKNTSTGAWRLLYNGTTLYLADSTATYYPSFTVGPPPTAGLTVTGGSFRSIIAQLFDRAVPPTYTAPTTSVNLTPSVTFAEVGTVYSSAQIALGHTFAQNDAGAETGTTFTKTIGGVTTAQTSPYNFTLTAQVDLKALTSYLQGPLKNDSHGNAYPTGRISAGSVTSGAWSLVPGWRRYWGVCAGATPTNTEVLAAIAAGGSDFTANHSFTISNITVSGSKHIFIAALASYGHITSLVQNGFPFFSAYTETTQTVTNQQSHNDSYYILTSNNALTSDSGPITAN